jgi:hypothetical protein
MSNCLLLFPRIEKKLKNKQNPIANEEKDLSFLVLA